MKSCLFLRSFLFLIGLVFSWTNASAISVMGHRGARGEFSENTIPGFVHALKKGVDIIEMDVRLSKDSKLIVSHNPSFSVGPKETCHWRPEAPASLSQLSEVTISESLASSLQYLQCDKKNQAFPDQQISPESGVPTLVQVIKALSSQPGGAEVHFSIEMKPNGAIAHPWSRSPDPETFATAMAGVLDEFDLWDRVFVDSFSPYFLKAIRSLNPRAQTTLSLLPVFGHLQLQSYSAPEIHALFNRVHLATLLYPPSLIQSMAKYLNRLGVEVFINDAHREEDWKPLLSTGITGISTDFPSDLIDYLAKKKSPHPIEPLESE